MHEGEFRMHVDFESIAEGRRRFDEWLRSAGVTAAAREDLGIALSELVTNAVKAAGPGGAEVHLRAWAESDSVHLEVENSLPQQEGIPGSPHLPPATSESGRGLYVVGQVTDDLRLERRGDRLLVHVRRTA